MCSKRAELQTYRLRNSSVNFAIQHVAAFGDTDILPASPALETLLKDPTGFREHIAASSIYDWALGPDQKLLTPKGDKGFRIATQLDPLDAVVFTALTHEAGADIEETRIAPERNVVHSHRFKPSADGRLYDQEYSFRSFRETSLGLARAKPGFVLITDIADFYLRIYHHPLENRLQSAVGPILAKLIIKFLGDSTQGKSYGLPIGLAASRLLGDLAISGIDQRLEQEGLTFCRFSDDYRIFCETRNEAWSALAFLAKTLLDDQGLTLQESKTRIISTEEFLDRFENDEYDYAREDLSAFFKRASGGFHAAESMSKAERSEEVCSAPTGQRFAKYGLNMSAEQTMYDLVDFDDLDPGIQEELMSLDLWGILADHLAAVTDRRVGLKLSLTRFLLRRIAALGLDDIDDLIPEKIDLLHAVFPDAVRAITSDSRNLSESQADTIGVWLLSLLENHRYGQLEFYRVWVLEPFTRSSRFGQVPDLIEIHNRFSDAPTRSQAIFALGRAHQSDWFGSMRHNAFSMGPWELRAFLYGARCLRPDEGKHWLQRINRRLTFFDQRLSNWSKEVCTQE